MTGGAPSGRFGLTAVASRIAAEVGCARKRAPTGKAELPPVWSPWSEATTTCVIGLSVMPAIVSTSRCVSSGFSCPSATSTPSDVMTMRLTVVMISPPVAWICSYAYTSSATSITRG